MALWMCPECKFTTEGRCKPRKCPNCGKTVAFVKKEDKPPQVKKSRKK
ncbi:MAG: RCKP-type rubredoxin-like domain-containing protein [bacterium JZ-2024 1]